MRWFQRWNGEDLQLVLVECEIAMYHINTTKSLHVGTKKTAEDVGRLEYFLERCF